MSMINDEFETIRFERLSAEIALISLYFTFLGANNDTRRKHCFRKAILEDMKISEESLQLFLAQDWSATAEVYRKAPSIGKAIKDFKKATGLFCGQYLKAYFESVKKGLKGKELEESLISIASRDSEECDTLSEVLACIFSDKIWRDFFFMVLSDSSYNLIYDLGNQNGADNPETFLGPNFLKATDKQLEKPVVLREKKKKIRVPTRPIAEPVPQETKARPPVIAKVEIPRDMSAVLKDDALNRLMQLRTKWATVAGQKIDGSPGDHYLIDIWVPSQLPGVLPADTLAWLHTGEARRITQFVGGSD